LRVSDGNGLGKDVRKKWMPEGNGLRKDVRKKWKPERTGNSDTLSGTQIKTRSVINWILLLLSKQADGWR
jgi:hypothetical protein